MINQSYRLSKAAIRDLRGIIRYTRDNFGQAQLNKYLDQLEQCAEALSLGNKSVRRLQEVHPDILYIRCQNHYIYGFDHGNSPFMIIAFFHERMDIMKRLKNRL